MSCYSQIPPPDNERPYDALSGCRTLAGGATGRYAPLCAWLERLPVRQGDLAQRSSGNACSHGRRRTNVLCFPRRAANAAALAACTAAVASLACGQWSSHSTSKKEMPATASRGGQALPVIVADALAWIPVDGGHDRACRGSNVHDFLDDYYTVHVGATSVQDCIINAVNTAGVTGIEYRRDTHNCEVWTHPIGTSVPLNGGTCLRYGTRDSTATTTTATTTTIPAWTRSHPWSLADGGLNKACRADNWADDSQNYYDVRMGLSFEECKDFCLENPVTCKGIEHHDAPDGRCEVWKRSIGTTSPANGFYCVRHEPQLATTTTTTAFPPWAKEPPWELVGGPDHGCRGPGGNDMDSSYILKMGTSLDECKLLCITAEVCMGIEHHTHADGRCEVWTARIGSGAPAKGYLCIRFNKKQLNGHAPLPAWTFQPPWSPADRKGLGRGCRSPAWDRRPGKYFKLYEHAASLDDCRRFCEEGPKYITHDWLVYDGLGCWSGDGAEALPGRSVFDYNATLEQCKDICAADPDCKAITVESGAGRGKCWPHKSIKPGRCIQNTRYDVLEQVVREGTNCTGIEYHAQDGRCEVWVRPLGRSAPSRGYVCLTYKPPLKINSTSSTTTRTAPPGYWMICANMGSCGTKGTKRWQKSPASLAKRVGNLSQVPSYALGGGSAAWRKAVDHWHISPPRLGKGTVSLQDIATFMAKLLQSDPFGLGNEVPWTSFSPDVEGTVVAITQRHLAFIVANALLGNQLVGVRDGLSATLARCAARIPTPTGIIYALLSLLAVLSQELKSGTHGRTLIAMRPKHRSDEWRHRLSTMSMSPTSICARDAGGGCDTHDFMAQGTPFQSVTSMAGSAIGEGSGLCDVADTQDESLVQFYGEVLAFVFFREAKTDVELLPAPWTLLGARRYMGHVSGRSPGAHHSERSSCGWLDDHNWLNQAMIKTEARVLLGSNYVTVAAGAFVAVPSTAWWQQPLPQCALADALNNRCDSQRRHFEIDIALWYQAYEPSMYHDSVQQAFRQTVHRIGTGPWGAGVWWGDSQQYFLVTWLATSLVGGVSLDYHIYDRFCENPGNQCFLFGGPGKCRTCIARGGSGAHLFPWQCGERSIDDMVARFSSKPVQSVFKALVAAEGPPKQVFDVL